MTYVVEIPAPCGWISANDRVPWQQKARQTREWRNAAGWMTKRARVPHLQRAEIAAEVVFQDGRRRDPDNYAPTVKAAIDGLVDVRVLDDDDSKHLKITGITLAVDPDRPRGLLRLLISSVDDDPEVPDVA